MTSRLLSPDEAVARVAGRLRATWAERVCAELLGAPETATTIRLRPGVARPADVDRVGYEAWNAWRTSWNSLDLTRCGAVQLEFEEIRVRGVETRAPIELRVQTLDAGLALTRRHCSPALADDVGRARLIAGRLQAAGAIVNPRALRAVHRLGDPDVAALLSAVSWLGDHPDLSGWTPRQLPIPDVHTKWVAKHEKLVRSLAERDVAEETRPRPSVLNFTYADPAYLATGRRRHDSWTTGDANVLAYSPRIVLVVENRDCRLWFPEIPDTIVVEGGGTAAAMSLGNVEWILAADHVIYWGDIDTDGFAILDHFREELARKNVGVKSILMTDRARSRYAHLGVNRDKHGVALTSSRRRLSHLTMEEAECYAGVATAGDVGFRRIEQERIPLADAEAALRELLSP